MKRENELRMMGSFKKSGPRPDVVTKTMLRRVVVLSNSGNQIKIVKGDSKRKREDFGLAEPTHYDSCCSRRNGSMLKKVKGVALQVPKKVVERDLTDGPGEVGGGGVGGGRTCRLQPKRIRWCFQWRLDCLRESPCQDGCWGRENKPLDIWTETYVDIKEERVRGTRRVRFQVASERFFSHV